MERHHVEDNLNEAPPAYEDSTSAPAYTLDNSPIRQPVAQPPLTFYLRQTGSRTQSLIPTRSSAVFEGLNGELIIQSKVGANLSRSRPDLVVLARANRRSRSTSPSLFSSSAAESPVGRRGSQLPIMSWAGRSGRLGDQNSEDPPDYFSSPEMVEQVIATARFARAGGFPWTPRARLVYPAQGLGTARRREFGSMSHALQDGSSAQIADMEMEEQRKAVWSTSIDGIPHQWHLAGAPVRLVLLDCDQTPPKMRAYFRYGEVGSRARAGKEVGTLNILQSLDATNSTPNCLSEEYIKQVICTLCVVTHHWRSEGKFLANPFTK